MKGVERHGVHVLPALVHRSSDVPPLGILAGDRIGEQEERRLFRDPLDFRRGKSLPYKTIENPFLAGPTDC